VTAFGYDGNDNLTAVTDPRGLVTSYVYNGPGDLTQLLSPDTGTTSSTFDEAGNQKTFTDARGLTATHSYDALNRVTSITYPDASLAWTYDASGRVTGMTQLVGGLSRHVSYGYENGNLTTMTTPSLRAMQDRFAAAKRPRCGLLDLPGALSRYLR
jgi:YD repeat-containing protein